jgi:hypothetical protein
VQAPQDTATGNVAIAVTNCKATSSPVMFARRAIAPGFLAPLNYTANGTQYIVATFASDGAYVLTTSGVAFGLNSRPAKPGDLIVAYGIGFGDVTTSANQSILPGVIVGQSNALINPIAVSFGSTPAAQLLRTGREFCRALRVLHHGPVSCKWRLSDQRDTERDRSSSDEVSDGAQLTVFALIWGRISSGRALHMSRQQPPYTRPPGFVPQCLEFENSSKPTSTCSRGIENDPLKNCVTSSLQARGDLAHQTSSARR